VTNRHQSGTGSSGLASLKKYLVRTNGTVAIPIVELHSVDDTVSHALDFLTDFIWKKMDELGFETEEQANAGSPDLCDLIYVMMLLEEAASFTEEQVKKSFIPQDVALG
jgi:hypothetical protein